jgi:hypothetical protein
MNLTLTNNFLVWVRTMMLGCSITSTSTSADGLISTVHTVGGVLKPTNYEDGGTEIKAISFDYAYARYAVSFNRWYENGGGSTDFIVGSDNTLPTIDDVNLKNRYERGTDYSIKMSAANHTTMVNEKACIVWSVQVIANNPITIGEIGLIRNIYTSSNSSTKECLFGRVALDTPVDLNAGEVATFQITIAI